MRGIANKHIKSIFGAIRYNSSPALELKSFQLQNEKKKEFRKNLFNAFVTTVLS